MGSRETGWAQKQLCEETVRATHLYLCLNFGYLLERIDWNIVQRIPMVNPLENVFVHSAVITTKRTAVEVSFPVIP